MSNDEDWKRACVLLKKIQQRAAATSELGRDLTSKIYMSIFNWITISHLSEAIRQLYMLHEISLDDGVIIDWIDQLIDLFLMRLFSYCQEIHAESYWMDTVKEFHKWPFFVKRLHDLKPYTDQCIEYCLRPHAFFDFRPDGYVDNDKVKIFTSDFDAVCDDNPNCFSIGIENS